VSWRRIAAAAAPAAATAVLLLGGLEWLVRTELDVYRCDPELGWTFRPGARGIKWNRQREFFERVEFNSAGFRDVERAAAPPPGAFRILALGDSFTASLQVPREETFLARLERELAQELPPGRSAEVINAGVDGYGTAQELLLHRGRFADFAVDLVLLQVFMENDLTDNARRAGDANHYLAARCGRPYFDFGEQGVRFAGRSAPAASDPPERWLRRSRMWTSLVPAPIGGNGAEPTFVNADLFRTPPPPALRGAWRLTQDLISMLRGEVRARGARFALLVVPDKRVTGQVDPAALFGVDPTALGRGHAWITGFARDQKIPLADLLPPLRAELEAGRPPYFQADSHLNREGHERAARALLAWLRDHCGELGVPVASCAAAPPAPGDRSPPARAAPR
jgi:lysophospholipase L1-like esterase